MTAPTSLSQIEYRFPGPLTEGRLIRRYKRFLADVELADGRVETVHCPNSGSMLASIEEGAPVRLSPADNPNRKTAFTWEMIFINGGWVGINTGLPNYLTAQAAAKQALPLFSDVVSVKREVKISAHTRIDLVAQTDTGPLYVEVKNVTLVRDGRASFPDAVTTRGQKHAAELTERAQAGERTALIFIVQRTDAEIFGPAEDIDPDYARLYRRARQAGVGIAAVEAVVSPEAVRLNRELPLEPL